MKKIVVLLIIFFSINNFCEGQVWSPAGATWHYGEFNFLWDGYRTVSYTNDTIINSVTCKQLTDYYQGYNYSYSMSGYYAPIFTYSQSGIVYIYNNQNGLNQFDTVYNINAQIGDSWRIPFDVDTCHDTLNIVHVLNIGSRPINGINLKWLYTRTTTYLAQTYFDTIFERMSSIRNFLYYTNPSVCGNAAIDYPVLTFRCYSDSTFGNYSTFSGVCDYYYTGINENENDTKINISPNPFTTQTTITFSEEQKNTTIKVMNVLGEVIQQLTTSNKQLTLDMSTVAKGIYFVRIEDEKKNVVNRKIVVE